MEYCKYNNYEYGDDNGRDIYGNGDDDNITDHDYHFEDICLSGTLTGEGKYPAHDGGLDR